MAAGLGCLLLLSGAESALRLKQYWIERSDQMAPGMTRYDPDLGWRLTPNWHGRHRNWDFDVQYSINSLGFRADSLFPDRRGSNVCAVVGDSFTFGLGVNDRQTFVHLLDANASVGWQFVNFAVPGYSTDQELLLIEHDVLAFKPQRILLVVYLGNDLLDNSRAVPVQGPGPKPFFDLGQDDHRLQLRNVPVPAPTGEGARSRRADLASAVLHGLHAEPHGFQRWLQGHLALARLVWKAGPDVSPDLESKLRERFQPDVRLFGALVARIRNRCRERGIRLTVALLTGRSFLEHPDTLSGRYQEIYRDLALQELEKAEIAVTDICSVMKRVWSRNGRPRWYYPNDGHLTPAGHAFVAKTLARDVSGGANPASP